MNRTMVNAFSTWQRAAQHYMPLLAQDNLNASNYCCNMSIDPNALDRYARPASHIAAAHGDTAILEFLLLSGGAIGARDSTMNRPLAVAVSAGQLNTARVLIDRGADLFAKDYIGQTLLEIASNSRKPAMFFALINAGLEPCLEDILSWYYLGHRQTWTIKDHLARLAVVPEFLLTGSNNSQARAVLSLVPPRYRKLNLTRKCTVRGVRMTALYYVSTTGGLRGVELSHGAGAMLNLEGGMEGTPLMGACRRGQLEVVKYLVRSGAILSHKKQGVQFSPFDKAASYPRIQRWLLVEQFSTENV
jgi:ankyrin repeat protein